MRSQAFGPRQGNATFKDAVAPYEFLALRDRLTTFEALAAIEQHRLTVRVSDDPEPLTSARVTASLLTCCA